MNTNWLRTVACAAPLFVAIHSTSAKAQDAEEPGSKTRKTDLNVVVKPGDTLTSIVLREMGSLDYWARLAEHNKLDAPDKLSPGDKIEFPWELLQFRNFAKVVFVKGTVTLQRKGESEVSALEKGTKVYIGDIIKTSENGFASLTFKGESLVNIQPDSHMLMQELECFDVKLACEIELQTDQGQMKLDINNVGFTKPTKFSIDTPYATAAVRGTVFDFATLEGNILGVTEGEVEISVNENSSKVPLGKGTLAGEGQSISVLYDLLGKPEYKDFLRVSAQDVISWSPLEKAENYKVVVASTASMTDVIRSTRTSQTLLQALPDPGTYYISTRGIAKNGLQGFRANQRIDQVKIDDSVDAPELEMELSENTLTIKAVGDNTTEIHIGDSLTKVDDLEQLVDFKSYDISAGDSLTLQVDTSKDIFLISRAVINGSTVSSYGNLYEFKKAGQ